MAKAIDGPHGLGRRGPESEVLLEMLGQQDGSPFHGFFALRVLARHFMHDRIVLELGSDVWRIRISALASPGDEVRIHARRCVKQWDLDPLYLRALRAKTFGAED